MPFDQADELALSVCSNFWQFKTWDINYPKILSKTIFYLFCSDEESQDYISMLASMEDVLVSDGEC